MMQTLVLLHSKEDTFVKKSSSKRLGLLFLWLNKLAHLTLSVRQREQTLPRWQKLESTGWKIGISLEFRQG